MNKNLYPWLIFFSALSAAAALLQSILHFLIGLQFFWLESFDIWFLIMNVTAFVGAILLLKYFYSQKYWFAFATGAFYSLCVFSYSILFYTILRFHQLTNFNAPLFVLTIVSGIVYAVSLMLLRAKNIRWLNAAGVYMLTIGIIMVSIYIWKNDRIAQWVTVAGSLAPLFYVMHFLSQLRKLGTDRVNVPVRNPLENLVGLAGILSFLLTLAFGVIISNECYSSIYWTNVNNKKTLELTRLCDPGIFVNGKGDILRYRLLKPLDYDPTKKYPIVISLPYGGQPETDTIRQIGGAVAALLLASDNNRRRYPAFVFIPNRPPGAAWGGIPKYPTVDSLVFEAIDGLDRQFSIDEKRRYVIGLSLGGFGTWNFICKRPDMFAAAIPVSGGGDPRLAPKAVNVAVWAFHGTKDKNAPVSGSRNMINAIKSAGGNPKYTEYPDEGHNIWDKVTTTPGLLDWLFAQHRK